MYVKKIVTRKLYADGVGAVYGTVVVHSACFGIRYRKYCIILLFISSVAIFVKICTRKVFVDS